MTIPRSAVPRIRHGRIPQGLARHSGPPGQRQQIVPGCRHPIDAAFQLVSPGAHLIAQPQRHRILKMGAPDLDDVHPAGGFCIETDDQLLQFRQQGLFELSGGCNVNRRWERVVR